MKTYTALSILSALALITHTASGQPIVDYDFEDGSTAGWAVHSSHGHNYLTVVEDPVRGTANKVLKVDATYGGLDTLRLALPESLSTGTYELKMQLMVSGSNGEAGTPNYNFDRRISFLDSTAATNKTATYIRYRRVTGYNEFNAYNGNGSGGGAWDGPQPLAYDQWYEITQVIDLDTHSWSWSLHNLTTGMEHYASETLGFFTNVPNIGHLVFLKIEDHSTAGLFYLDNVRMAAIPESGSVALVLAGGVVGVAGYALRVVKKN